MRKAAIFLLFAVTVFLYSCREEEHKPVANHVILIGPDGFSSAVIRENPGAFPNIEKLMREGSHTLRRRSVLPSSSAVNWASMLMGAGPELHGYTTWSSEVPDLPSRTLTEKGLFPCIMYLLRDSYPDMEMGCGYTWPTIGRLFDASAVNFNHHNESKDEAQLCDAVCAYIEARRPGLTFVAFDQPDGTGHKHGWESDEYLEQCISIDSYVGRIMDAAEKAGIADDLIVIFTSDHGGIGKGHGGKTMNEMEAPFVVWGKGIKADHEITESVMVFDTASTIASIFRLEQPQVWTGRPVTSVFQ